MILMANFSDKINDLFRRRQWEKARELLEKEREKAPENHWLLTQLGVTFTTEEIQRRPAIVPGIAGDRGRCPLRCGIWPVRWTR